MKALYMQYQLPIMLGLAAFLLGYIFILNLQLAYQKNKADELRIEVKNWQFTYKTLAESAEKQNEVIKDMAKIGLDMQALGDKLLKDATLANGIRTPKINAATARLNAAIKVDCNAAIANAKKELTP